MQIPVEVIAAIIVAWIGLQLSLLRRIGKLETQQALNKQRLNATERLLDDILERYFHNRDPRSKTKRNLDPDIDPGNDDIDDGSIGG